MPPSKLTRTAIFWTILATQTISLLGSRMSEVGVGLWVYNRTGSTTPLLMASFFMELPGMLLSSAAGVLVDRYPRRLVLLVSDAGQAVGSLLLLASLVSGRFEVWHLYLASLVQGVFATLQAPAEDATVTLLVPESWRDRANAFRESAFPFAGVGAPVMAAFLFTWVGIQGIILLDLATFLVAVAALALVRLPQPPPSAEGSQGKGNFWGEWQAGLGFLRRRPALLYFLLFNTLVNFLLNGPLGLNLPYLVSRTGDVRQAGSIIGVLNLGALCGALLMTVWGGTRPRMHTLMPGLMLCGCMIMLYGLSAQPLALGVAAFLIYLPLPVGNAVLASIIQAKAPPDLQGRIFAFNDQLSFLGSTVSFLVTGPLVDGVLEPAVHSPGWRVVAPLVGSRAGSGIGLLLALTGAILLLLTGAVYAWPLVRNLERDLPGFAPPPAEAGEPLAPG